jgi:hypothetical protein
MEVDPALLAVTDIDIKSDVSKTGQRIELPIPMPLLKLAQTTPVQGVLASIHEVKTISVPMQAHWQKDEKSLQVNESVVCRHGSLIPVNKVYAATTRNVTYSFYS